MEAGKTVAVVLLTAGLTVFAVVLASAYGGWYGPGWGSGASWNMMGQPGFRTGPNPGVNQPWFQFQPWQSPGYGMGGMMGSGMGMGGMMASDQGMGSMMQQMHGWGGGMMGGYGMPAQCQEYMNRFAPGQTQGRPSALGPNEVAISGYAFYPQTLTVKRGTTVTWTNFDPVGHTVSAGAPGKETGLFESALLGRGESFRFTFRQPGVYIYHCDPHPFMTGVVVVEE